jgi:hypothetical protein
MLSSCFVDAPLSTRVYADAVAHRLPAESQSSSEAAIWRPTASSGSLDGSSEDCGGFERHSDSLGNNS